MEEGQPTVVVLTALRLEFLAVRRHLTDVERVEYRGGTSYDVGRVAGLPWRVALAEIGEGTSGAAMHTERAIALFEPAAVFFVGVAGSLRDDVGLGDVVVASKVYLHHGAKEEDDGARTRPRAWEIRHDVEQRVRRALREEDLRTHFKPLVAGDVVLNSRTSPLADRIDRVYNDAVAIDMESAGLAQAAHLNNLPMLAIRGISDFADGRKSQADATGSQPRAARNAAEVAVRILRELPVPRTRSGPPAPSPVVVLAAPPAASAEDTTAWRGGAVVDAAGESCLLHDGPGDLLAETASPDHSVVRRQALARVLPGPGGTARYVWLRQAVKSYDTPVAEAALRALSVERNLLGEIRGCLPVAHCVRRGDTVTLTQSWPVSRRSRMPCETLADLVEGHAQPLDAWRLQRVLRGLTRLSPVLEHLHRKRLSHRALQPAGLVLTDDGRLLLRDLGLARTPPTPGEAPGRYQAPEQLWRRTESALGPATDVYRLAALTHRLLTGNPPAAGMPSALRRSTLPGTHTIEAALALDPADRPGTRELFTALHELAAHFAAAPTRKEQ